MNDKRVLLLNTGTQIITAMIYTTEYLDPMETAQVQYWSRKWRITCNQLFDAILDTGSMRINVLRQHLENKGLIPHPFKSVIGFFSLKKA